MDLYIWGPILLAAVTGWLDRPTAASPVIDPEAYKPASGRFWAKCAITGKTFNRTHGTNR
jgi:hypothetical protein